MKRIAMRVMTMLWMLAMLSAAAAEPMETVKPEDERMEPVYTFDLSVNGKHEVAVEPGDVITVVFTITRMDEDEENSYTMFAMQNEIEYDDAFVLPMENGCITQAEIDTQDIALRGHGRAFYMNYLSFIDGSEWQDQQLVGTFQLQVNGENGITELKNSNFCVTKPGAQESYAATSNDLMLYVSDDCTIRFECNGGSLLDDATVDYGELLTRPMDPIKEGFHLRGWYKDYDLTEEWNFENNPISENMVLYAGWDEGKPTATAAPKATPAPDAEEDVQKVKRVRIVFDTNGGEPVADIWVEENQSVAELPEPTRTGYRFAGWYKDAKLREAWDCESDRAVDKRTKFYAAWEED